MDLVEVDGFNIKPPQTILAFSPDRGRP